MPPSSLVHMPFLLASSVHTTADRWMHGQCPLSLSLLYYADRYGEPISTATSTYLKQHLLSSGVWPMLFNLGRLVEVEPTGCLR